jgi:RNA polymerase sigma-70 factor (ECF subfamily)
MNSAVLRTERDRVALEAISKRYREVLRRYFARRRLTGSDNEDAVQEVFAKLAQRAGVAEIEKLEAYLFETAANVATDHFRRSTVRRHEAHDPYDEQLHAIEVFSPERVHQGREELQRLLKALNELPQRTRDIFILARLEHLKHPEIARRIGVSVSAVEKHIVKAAAHLSLRMGRP